jgi:hypothetical protein
VVEPAQIEYLKTLAKMASSLDASRSATAADLECFRAWCIKRPDDLRRRLLGANVVRRRDLEGTQRRGLDVLDCTPDLLGPLGELRYEPSHSRLIARFMDVTLDSLVAPALLREFLKLGGADPALADGDVRQAEVQPERWCRTGRIDISISLPKLLVFVEMKIDAEEGAEQLLRYSKELEALKGERDGLLVYLTRPGVDESSSTAKHTHVTLDALVRAWLPFAGPGVGPEEYLARYLKSLALLLGCAGLGRFDDWTIAEQRNAIELVEAIT